MLESNDIENLKNDIKDKGGHKDLVEFVEVANSISASEGTDNVELLERLWDLSNSSSKEVSEIRNEGEKYQSHIWQNGVEKLMTDHTQFDIDINREDRRQLRMSIESVYERHYL